MLYISHCLFVDFPAERCIYLNALWKGTFVLYKKRENNKNIFIINH